MKKIFSIYTCCSLLLFAACGGTSSNDELANQKIMMEEPAPRMTREAMGDASASGAQDKVLEQSASTTSDIIRNDVNATTSAETKKKIIKDGNMTLKTEDLEASKKSLDALLKKWKAYYESEEMQRTDMEILQHLKIRIPAENFDAFLADLEKGGEELRQKSVQARDVTEEYVDVSVRLKNKRAYMERYRALLSKANSVKDVLSVEENIRQLQEEIESAEGRLKYLNDQVAYSTLFLTLQKELPYTFKAPAQGSFGERVKNSLHRGWILSVQFLLWLIRIWPVYIVLGVVWLIRKKWKQRGGVN